MRVLIAGGTGQVGWELLRACPAHWSVQAASRSDLDLAQPDGIRQALRQSQPDVVINATGYTAVDRAESEPDLARLVNAEAVGVLAHEARSCGALLVQYSTDYIFDGRKSTPYAPDDAPNPLSVYGRSKLEGERAVIDSGVRHLILRAQWVYGLRGRNFVLAILGQGARRRELRVVNDQIGAPTWARSIAQATVEMLSRLRDHTGIYHIACAGSTNWHEFACAVFEEVERHCPGLTLPRILPVSTQEYGARVQRPAHAVLDCSATLHDFGVQLPHWRDALREAFGEAEMLREALAPYRAEPAPAALASGREPPG